jgi:hypothetical protein
MQSPATTVGQAEVASSPCHIRSAVLPASGSEFPRAPHADQRRQIRNLLDLLQSRVWRHFRRDQHFQ